MAECRDRLDAVAAKLDGAAPRPTLLLEWTDPAFTDGHWVPDMIAAAGGRSVMGRPGQNSQGATWDRVGTCGAEVVIVAPCGFRLAGAAELAEQVVARGVLPAGAEVWAVDADAFVVRPSPRVVDGVEIFASILHPAAPRTARRRRSDQGALTSPSARGSGQCPCRRSRGRGR